MTRVLGAIVVDNPLVGGNMLIHMELPVNISMTILVDIFLNGSMLHVARVTCGMESFLDDTDALLYLWHMFTAGGGVYGY